MSQTTKKLEASLVHRWFKVAPGSAPEWIYSGGCPEDAKTLDVFFLPIGIAALLVVACIAFHFWLGLLPIAALFWIIMRLMTETETCERKARARIRRGECIWCGAKGVPAGICESCRN